MARKKEPTLVHPLTAIEALNGYHSDVSILLTAVQSALSLITDKDIDARKACNAVAPSLEESMERVRRWYVFPE